MGRRKITLINNLYNKDNCCNSCRKTFVIDENKCLRLKIEKSLKILSNYLNNLFGNNNKNIRTRGISRSTILENDYELILVGNKERLLTDISKYIDINGNFIDSSGNIIEIPGVTFSDESFIHLDKNGDFFKTLPIRIQKIINFINKYIPNINTSRKVGRPILYDLINGTQSVQKGIKLNLGEHTLGLVKKAFIPFLLKSGYGGNLVEDISGNITINKKYYWKVNNLKVQIFDSTSTYYLTYLKHMLLNYLIATERFIIGKPTTINDTEYSYGIASNFGDFGWNNVRTVLNGFWETSITTGGLPTLYVDTSTDKKYLPFPNYHFGPYNNNGTIGFNTSLSGFNTTFSEMIINENYNIIDYLFFKNSPNIKVPILLIFEESENFEGIIFPNEQWAYQYIDELIDAYVTYSLSPSNLAIGIDFSNREQAQTVIIQKLFEYAIHEGGLTNANIWLKEYLSFGLYLITSVADGNINTSYGDNFNLGTYGFNDNDKNYTGYIYLDTSNYLYRYKIAEGLRDLVTEPTSTGIEVSYSSVLATLDFLKHTIYGTVELDSVTNTITLLGEWLPEDGYNWVRASDSSDPEKDGSVAITDVTDILYGNFNGTRTGGYLTSYGSTLGLSNYWLQVSKIREILNNSSSLTLSDDDVHRSFSTLSTDDGTGAFRIIYSAENNSTGPAIDISGQTNHKDIPIKQSGYWMTFGPQLTDKKFSLNNLYQLNNLSIVSNYVINKYKNDLNNLTFENMGFTYFLYVYSVKKNIDTNNNPISQYSTDTYNIITDIINDIMEQSADIMLENITP